MAHITTEFNKSSSEISKCPTPDRPEYAFIGRSNVGKSSLINMITDRKALAKTSQTPGKTQLINHFNIDDWFLVDLPGYGYAKASKTARKTWQKFITDYLTYRENLMCVFVLIDIRHSLQKIDDEFMFWLGENNIPFVIVFTKQDKIAKSQVKKHVSLINKALLETWDELPRQFMTSASHKIGGKEIMSFIKETNSLYKKP
jgi:GTP-binding protein